MQFRFSVFILGFNLTLKTQPLKLMPKYNLKRILAIDCDAGERTQMQYELVCSSPTKARKSAYAKNTRKLHSNVGETNKIDTADKPAAAPPVQSFYRLF